jgi:hypothetical protein
LKLVHTFVPANRTIDFASILEFDIRRLLAIRNTRTNQFIYLSGQSGLGYSSVAGAVVTLQFDTTSMLSNDPLQVYYDTQYFYTDLPPSTQKFLPVRSVPQTRFRTTFSATIASGIDSESFTIIRGIGTGQTVAQSSGNLVLGSGTTANSETVIRSNQSFSDSHICRWSMTLSQRIVNNNFFVELVDVIGDGLSFTILSATQVRVTIPNNPFTSTNVGQAMYLGAISGVAAAIPGRYAIAVVSGNDVTFTVAGWPASGTGTLSLFGWNFHHVVYSGTTATNTQYDAQRRGWASGFTTATINTTVAPGHVGIMSLENEQAAFLDQLAASTNILQTTMRASRVQNLPAQDARLFLQIRMLNGSTAPASNTTATLGFVSVENYAAQNVMVNSIRPMAFNSAMPVAVLNSITVGGTVSVSGTVTANIGTGSLAAGTNAIGDVGIQYRGNNTGAATIRHIVSAVGTNAANVKATAGRVVGWSLTNTTAAFKYVKLHNTAGVPTAGAGVVQTIGIPPNSTVANQLPGGAGYSTGIGITIVNGPADNDTTAVAANDVVGDLFFA